jgi:hypothetical protein
VALLHRVRRRNRFLKALIPGLLAASVAVGCDRRAPAEADAHRPDARLRSELGLGDNDVVYRVTLTVQGYDEQATPSAVEVPRDAWVEFVTGDWRIHQVRFERDSLTADGRDFLVASDQMASPPLVDRDARFVVSFAQAPPGRYPFVVEGSATPARGVVVVGSKR